MQYEEFFIQPNLPNPLEKEELYNCFNKMHQGDKEARNKIIKSNIRLVLMEVKKRFMHTNCDLNELVSIGIIGLIKGIDTFDINKKINFSTYVMTCIDNEILMFLKKNKKYLNNISLYQPVLDNDQGKEINIIDTLEDFNSNFSKEYEDKELYIKIREIVNELADREKEIIIKYFGFEDEPKGQAEIAAELGLSQAQISRIIKKVLKEIRLKLEQSKVIEKRNLILKYTNDNINSAKIKDIAKHFLSSNLSVNEFTKKYCEFSRATLNRKFLNKLSLLDPELAILVAEKLNAKNPRLNKKKRQS